MGIVRTYLASWRALVGSALAALALAGAAAERADAAGMVTHAWMAESGIAHVTDPKLRGLLAANAVEVGSGAAYPDSGYIVGGFYDGGDYGEISHWERFVNGYVQHVRDKVEAGECGEDLADPLGPCAGLVAHLMGAAAHGIGDEMWDWLFEPQFADRGEDPGGRHRIDDYPGHEHLAGVSPDLAHGAEDLEYEILHGRIGPQDLGFPGDLIYSSEYTMDVIAIADHRRLLWSPTLPPIGDLLQIYSKIGYDHIDAAGLIAGHTAVNGVLAAERLSLVEAHSVRLDLPWTSAHMDDESGGVHDVGLAVAGYYEALWRKLHAPGGETPAPVVTSVHPEPEERGVPTRWQPAKTEPGPYPGRGGAENRIVAVLSHALDSQTVTSENFMLLDAEGAEVPALPGFPRPGPYGNGDGTHTMLFYPAVDLEPCATYTARVTTGLRDWSPGADGWSQSGLAAPHEWRFQTRSADGTDCPPLPDRPDTGGGDPGPPGGGGSDPGGGDPGGGDPGTGNPGVGNPPGGEKPGSGGPDQPVDNGGPGPGGGDGPGGDESAGERCARARHAFSHRVERREELKRAIRKLRKKARRASARGNRSRATARRSRIQRKRTRLERKRAQIRRSRAAVKKRCA